MGALGDPARIDHCQKSNEVPGRCSPQGCGLQLPLRIGSFPARKARLAGSSAPPVRFTRLETGHMRRRSSGADGVPRCPRRRSAKARRGRIKKHRHAVVNGLREGVRIGDYQVRDNIASPVPALCHRSHNPAMLSTPPSAAPMK